METRFFKQGSRSAFFLAKFFFPIALLLITRITTGVHGSVPCARRSHSTFSFFRVTKTHGLHYTVGVRHVGTENTLQGPGFERGCNGALVSHHEVQRLLKKMKAELGGVPWRISHMSEYFSSKHVMCLGLYVPKDLPKGLAITAVAASFDGEMTRYFTNGKIYRLQDIGTFMFPPAFAEYLSEAISAYREYNQQLPSAVVMYGRGINATGRFGTGLTHEELSMIKRCFEKPSTGDATLPPYSYTLVNDECRLRIYRHEKKNPLVTNPLCGMMVEDMDYRETAIVTEKINHGTLSPTCYQSIEDFIGLEEQYAGMLTIDLCHLNYADPASSCIPAPLVYAEKFCQLHALSDVVPPRILAL